MLLGVVESTKNYTPSPTPVLLRRNVVEEAYEAEFDVLFGENGAFAFDGRRYVTTPQRRVKRAFIGGCVVKERTAKNANPPTSRAEIAAPLVGAS